MKKPRAATTLRNKAQDTRVARRRAEQPCQGTLHYPRPERTWANCGAPVAILGDPQSHRVSTLAGGSRHALHSQFRSSGVESVAHTTRWAALATRSCEHLSTKSSSAYNLGKSLICSTETGSNSRSSFPVRSKRTWVSSWMAYPIFSGSRERTARSAMSRIAIRHFCANSKFARGEAEFSRVIESSSLSSGDFRSFHSCMLLVAFLGDFGERTAVAIQHRINSEVVTIPLADHIHVPGFKFHQKRAPMMFGRRDECPPDPGKGVENDLMRIGGVEDRLFHESDGLGRRMERTRLRPRDFPNRILVARRHRVMRGTRRPPEVDWLVAVVIIHAAHNQRVLHPHQGVTPDADFMECD